MKLKILIRKNLILMKRNFLSTLFEIFFPICMFCLIIVLRQVLTRETEHFENRESNTKNYTQRYAMFSSLSFLKADKLRGNSIFKLLEGFAAEEYNGSIQNLDSDKIDYVEFIANDKIEKFREFANGSEFRNFINQIDSYLGLTYFASPFKICSKGDEEKFERPKIAVIGEPLPYELKKKMIIDSIIYNVSGNISFELSDESFVNYSSLEEMEDFIKSESYQDKKENLICFGIRYKYTEEKNTHDFALHFFDFEKIGRGNNPDIPSNKQGMFDKFQSGPDIRSIQLYQQGTYNYMMKIIHEYILKKVSGNNHASLNYAVFPMKYWDNREDDFGELYGYVMVIIVLIAYMIPLSIYIYKIVREKETKTKEIMKIMGLGEAEYILSYFIQYLIISIFVSAVNSILFKIVLTKIQYYFIFGLIFLFSLDIFALIYFFQSFIDKTRISIILSLIIYWLMYCLALVCLFENSSFWIKLFLALFPAVNLNLGVALLNKFEFHFKKFYNRDFIEDYFNYSLIICYIMFVVDFFFFIFLGYYLNNVLPHDFGIRRPWNFLCTLKFWNPKRKKRKERFSEFFTRKDDISLSTSFNRFRYRSGGPAFPWQDEENKEEEEGKVLEIRNLIKIYRDGERFFNGLNLYIYKDEVLTLLGPNGAGKTTLISILAGIYEANKGKVCYEENNISDREKDIYEENNNILDSNIIGIFRRKLGICPQHDVLFEDLTIREHLEMFSIFKGVSSENVDEIVRKTLKDFQITDIQGMMVKNLSSGQKRQLSVAISIIGGSEIIFLDEPSNGMDITSRRNLWKILKSQSSGKTIIIATNSIEEASILGKRIAIINVGRIKFIGTPLFLIEKYGKFMSLNLTKDIGAINDEIVDFMKTLSYNLEYEILNDKIMFRIPVLDCHNEERKLRKCLDIQKFFTNFDAKVNELKIKSYNVSMPNVEDAFLNIVNEEEIIRNKEKEILIKKETDDKALYSLDLIEKKGGYEKFKKDFKICMKRRSLITIRDIKGIIMEIIGSIILVLFGLLMSKLQITSKSEPYLLKDLELMGKQTIIFSSINGENYTDYFDVNRSSYVNYTYLNLNYTNNSIIINFTDQCFDIFKDKEDRDNKSVDMSDNDYNGYYGALLMLSQYNYTNYDFLISVNPRVKHGLPIYSHYFLKSIIEREYNRTKDHEKKPLIIKYTHHPMPLTKKLKEQSDIINNIVITFLISIAFGIMPANFIYMLVNERINSSKYLMRISGINVLSYWCANYIFEIVKYYVTGGICLLLLLLFNYCKKYFYIFYLIYGPAMISFTYFLSFFFKKESKAQNTIILINFVFCGLGSISVLLFRLMNGTRTLGKIVGTVLSFIPSFCLDFAFNLLVNKEKIYLYEFDKDEYYKLAENSILVRWEYLLNLIIFCSSEILVYTILFMLAEKITYLFKMPTNNILYSRIEDIEVKKEIEKANSNDEYLLSDYSEKNGDITNKQGENKKLVVNVKNLKKVYGNGCCSNEKKIAIENLNFCIESGECFGLLGLNGAGKTTAFKCITQEILQDNGEIRVFGQVIHRNFDKLNEIFGYCPQFDAFFENLTVYENLEFYATIKGIKPEFIHNLVINMILKMSLFRFINKMAGKLSLNNKRKLSVAISMLGNPPIILLDEPLIGMDPVEKRFMWSFFHKMLTKGRKSNIIMTTHSADEAETFCNRIGIMINGEFVCLGTASQIREKYGYDYEVDVRISPMSKEKRNEYLYNCKIEDEKVDINNIKEILIKLGKEKFFDELREGRLGEGLIKQINNDGQVNIEALFNWVFFVENALKFIFRGKKYFNKIILSQNIDNYFLFKLGKVKEQKSIGFIFSLFELGNKECHIIEFFIQQNSLEQIFSKFIANQRITYKQIDNNFESNDEEGIIIDDELINTLIE